MVLLSLATAQALEHTHRTEDLIVMVTDQSLKQRLPRCYGIGILTHGDDLTTCVLNYNE